VGVVQAVAGSHLQPLLRLSWLPIQGTQILSRGVCVSSCSVEDMSVARVEAGGPGQRIYGPVSPLSLCSGARVSQGHQKSNAALPLIELQ